MNRRHFPTAAGASAALAMNRQVLPQASSTLLEALVLKSGFAGTVLLERSGEALMHKGFGPAERNFGTPCAADTRYRIASITKLFTSTLILQLAAEKKVELDKTIGAYLPKYAGPARDKSTIRQLLHHTSGIENFDVTLTSFAAAETAGMPAYQMPHTSDDLLRLFASGPLIHEPGSIFAYNNADFVILGKIVEAVEATGFASILERRIVRPLGLDGTGLFPARTIQTRLASTYYSDKEHPLGNDLSAYFDNWYAAGGMTSSARDLLVFAKALFGGGLVPSSWLQQMLTPGLEDYGFGLWIGSLEVNGSKHRFAQRPGRIMGANTLLLHFLDDPLTAVLLGNTNLADTDALGFTLAKEVLTS